MQAIDLRRVRSSGAYLLLVALALALSCAAPPASQTALPHSPKETADVPPATNASMPAITSAGYVDDATCAGCHARLYESYQGVGMARSMARPRVENAIEKLGEVFFHATSQRYFQIERANGKLVFRRWLLGKGGQREHELELPVDWIVGSGHRSRVYLYRTPSGELYQLPLAWYPQEGSWGMAPGYDRAGHEDVERPVRRECLFCHNAYPASNEGSDAKWAAQTFPEVLPEGIGCQRCHGPGGGHIKAVVEGGTLESIRAAIVNPARLSPERRDSVCFQCHMLPAVEMIGVRRFDRGVYSFRPGELLSDYMLHVDVDETTRSRKDRFEINHHAWRLTQSPCHLSGKLTCIDCHDPHQPLRSDTRLARVNEVCLRCHARHDPVAAPAGTQVKPDDCAGCHMPRRRTQDVVHVTMTDHRIERAPAADLLAPLTEREPDITALAFADPAAAPKGHEADIYRAVTLLRANARLTAPRAHLERVLLETPPESRVPMLDLISAQLQQRRFAEAEEWIARLPEKERLAPLTLGWLGIARVGLGRTDEALADLRNAVAAAPEVPEAHFNLGLVLQRSGAHAESLAPLGRALELRPNLVAAFFARAESLEALGRNGEAIADLQRALAIRPQHARARASLERLQAARVPAHTKD